MLEHLRLISEGPVLWAPAVDGAVVVSLRGERLRADRGPGPVDRLHRATTPTTVTLYLEESLTFRAAGPEAAIALRYAEEPPPKRRRR